VGVTAQESPKQDLATSPHSANASAIAADADQGPVTVKTASDSKKSEDTDPILGVPPLPKGKTTLVGGRITHIDGVHNRLSVKVFDGGKWNIAFDERTHFYRDGAETTFANMKKGDRVYVDTMLDGHEIFARNVHVVTHTGPASASGQVMAFNNGVMTIHDDLSAQPVRFRVDGNTQVTRNGSSASEGALREGTLVAVHFSPDTPNRGVAREVKILAEPGQAVTFYGKVTNVDLRNRQFAVANHTDNKTYDIAMDENYKVPRNLTVGSEVSVAAVFDGGGYKAQSISVKQ
jgi:hypothetical protein